MRTSKDGGSMRWKDVNRGFHLYLYTFGKVDMASVLRSSLTQTMQESEYGTLCIGQPVNYKC